MTPFAERAVDRGLTGVLVSLVRELDLAYNGNLRAQEFNKNSPLDDHVVRYLWRRAEQISGRDISRRVEEELEDRLDNWDQQRSTPGRRLAYSQPVQADDIAGLLHSPRRDPGGKRPARPRCATSNRASDCSGQKQADVGCLWRGGGAELVRLPRPSPSWSIGVRCRFTTRPMTVAVSVTGSLRRNLAPAWSAAITGWSNRTAGVSSCTGDAGAQRIGC